jgi:hypothetical protein
VDRLTDLAARAESGLKPSPLIICPLHLPREDEATMFAKACDISLAYLTFVSHACTQETVDAETHPHTTRLLNAEIDRYSRPETGKDSADYDHTAESASNFSCMHTT